MGTKIEQLKLGGLKLHNRMVHRGTKITQLKPKEPKLYNHNTHGVESVIKSFLYYMSLTRYHINFYLVFGWKKYFKSYYLFGSVFLEKRRIGGSLSQFQPSSNIGRFRGLFNYYDLIK